MTFSRPPNVFVYKIALEGLEKMGTCDDIITLYDVRCTKYEVRIRFTMYDVRSTKKIYDVRCTLYDVDLRCTMYEVDLRSTLYVLARYLDSLK